MINAEYADKNYRPNGFNPEKEKSDMSPADWIGGTSVENIKGFSEDISENQELINYLPTGEVQRGAEDFMDCASRGPHNIVETKLNYHLKSGKMSLDNIQWLNDNGFIDDNGNVSISDRFTAILSGTTANGNSLKAPLDSLRKNGFIPKKMLPASSSMTQYQYLKKSSITQAMRDLGQESIKRFPINYIRYTRKDFDNVSKYDLLDIAVFAWPNPVNGIYPRVWNNNFNHCVMKICKAIKHTIFDNYEDSLGGVTDYLKQLAPDYDLYNYGYRLIINENIFSFELTCDMCRYIYLLRPDVRAEFPASNQFYSINDPTKKYNIYDWARSRGWRENPDVFLKNILDYSLIATKNREALDKEVELLTPEIKKKTFWESLIAFIRSLLKND